ncbi:MAG: hypothetical protein IK126_02160 [Bacteroidales bacterium]|nr:hypothetical protein [Bacteroidales bacterium]
MNTTQFDQFDSHPSKKIYSLRREKRLAEARSLAESLIQKGMDDDGVIKAYAWTLIDLAKNKKDEGDIEEANNIIARLDELDIDPEEDDFSETIVRSINRIRVSIDPHFETIQQAKELSKNGSNDHALQLLTELYNSGKLSENFHEDLGWAIYRYLKEHLSELNSIQVRTLLRDYMALKNERPSMLHSQFLNFALNYSKIDSNFKFVNFLQMWRADNIRMEDFEDSSDSDGKRIPSLMSRIARVVVTYPKEDIKKFANLLPYGKEKFNNMMQEHFFWNLYHISEQGKLPELWNTFDLYLNLFADSAASQWNSKILSLAERVMKENDAIRFFSFFKQWNPNKLRDEDWNEEIGSNGEKYQPIAIKSIKKATDALKSQTNKKSIDVQWLIDIYEVAITKYPDNEWLIRSKALLHTWCGQLDLSKQIYERLVLTKGDKYYIWHEYSDCYQDNETKIALLCKAISLEKNEDFIGKIRLDLASCLTQVKMLENALYELNKYKEHYENKGWHLDSKFEELKSKCSGVVPVADNTKLYSDKTALAEQIAYAKIPFTEMVIVDMWKHDNGKDMISFVDGKDIYFSMDVKKFPILKKAHIGQVWSFKLFKEELATSNQAFPPLENGKTILFTPLAITTSDLDDWASLPIDYGYIQYINTEKKVYHIYSTASVFFPIPYEKIDLQVGDFVRFRKYKKSIKGQEKEYGRKIEKSEESVVLNLFKTRIVAVDDVNMAKQLFHFVLGPKLLDGILHFNQTDLRPAIGDCIKIYFYVRRIDDKKNVGHSKKVIEVIKAELADEINSSLVKEVEGELKIKYRNGIGGGEPVFAFVGDYYVHHSILKKYNIDSDCHVKAKVVYTGDNKWKVYEISHV